jgi:uncharacterized RDD family membrane protein YckC
MQPATDVEEYQAATLPRRLAAMIYDGLLLLALLMIATACFLPFTGGKAVTWRAFPALTLVYWCVQALLLVGYFGVAWTRGGQTLGMASWRLRVQRDDGRLLGWGDTVRRIGASVLSWLPAGLGWFWCLFDRERPTWHDLLSRTRVIVLPKRAAAGESTR